jgi:hypothetical protein
LQAQIGSGGAQPDRLLVVAEERYEGFLVRHVISQSQRMDGGGAN